MAINTAWWMGETYLIGGDGVVRPAPADWWRAGLGALLDRVTARADRAGVLLLMDDRACRLIGLPDGAEVDPQHPAVKAAAAAGWECSGLSDWTHFHRKGRPGVRLGLIAAQDRRMDSHGGYRWSPWWSPAPADSMVALARWRETTGSHWRGTPGMAGMGVMVDRAPQRGQGSRVPPTWRPSVPAELVDAQELDYRPGDWRAPAGTTYVHGYDSNRAYVAAASSLRVCPWGLKPTGRTPWKPTIAGWWKVELPHVDGVLAWNRPELPHPAGYLDGNPPVRWVTGPTMGLLAELTEAGEFGGVEILDSWTGPARDYPLGSWALAMRDAYAAGYDMACDLDPAGDILRSMAKYAGRATLGLLAGRTNWARRSDWWHAIIAQNRVNTWRKINQACRSGHRAVRVEVDCVWYASDDPNINAAVPSTYDYDRCGLRLGAVKPKGTRRVMTREGVSA